MKLANDNLMEAFLFLCRNDLDSLHLVRRQFHVIIEEGLKRSCLRSIYCADILFYKDRNAFETRLKVDLYQDYVFTVQFDSIMAAMEQLLLLMKASFVEGLYFLDVELSEAVFACADKVGVYARVQEVYIECCDLSSTSERFVSTLIRRFGGCSHVYLNDNVLPKGTISDAFLADLADTGVVFFKVSCLDYADMGQGVHDVTENGILQFCQRSSIARTEWYQSCGRMGLCIYNIRNCGLMLQRLLTALKSTGRKLLPTNVRISISPLRKEEVEQNDVKLNEVFNYDRTTHASSFDCGETTKGCLTYDPELKMLDISLEQL